MYIKNATLNDFETAFHFIENLWEYNTYDKEIIQQVYREVIEDPNSFAFFLIDEDTFYGFCHGVYFNTFWMSGQTCYVSSLITESSVRGKGYGTFLLNHAKELAKNAGCNCMILDSALTRKSAHQFYENYGFEKGCYGFELIF